jgi:hypothetical protein
VLLGGAIAAALCAGCGSTDSVTGGGATVSGRVIYRGCIGAAPATPVPCDSPKDGVTIEFTSDQQGNHQVTTASGGKYSVELASGSYKVDLHVKTALLDGPASITVQKEQNLNIDFVVQGPYT